MQTGWGEPRRPRDFLSRSSSFLEWLLIGDILKFAIVCKHFPQTGPALFLWEESVNKPAKHLSCSHRRLKVTGHRVTLKRACCTDVSFHCCFRCHVIQGRLYKCFLTWICSQPWKKVYHLFLSPATCFGDCMLTLTSGSQPLVMSQRPLPAWFTASLHFLQSDLFIFFFLNLRPNIRTTIPQSNSCSRSRLFLKDAANRGLNVLFPDMYRATFNKWFSDVTSLECGTKKIMGTWKWG